MELREKLQPTGAMCTVEHWRAGKLLDRQVVHNVTTNAGMVQYHKQCLDSSGLSTNGNNYIALSNDAVSEGAGSTTLTNEIVANGLERAQGTVTLAAGAGRITTVAKTFTATGNQSAQKAALFNAGAAGTMNHVLAFTQRSLITNDQLVVTFSITIS
jgi:hypothetical protein